MTEHLRLFQDIATSADFLVSNQSGSQEIERFALGLQQAIQPCFSELERSASILKDLLKPCFDELTQAEEEWESKPNVIQACPTAIREQVGSFLGYLFKLRLLKSRLISQVIEQAQFSWQQRINKLKVNWFIDSKNNNLKSISPLDKEKFVQALRFEFYPQSNDISSALAQALKPIQLQLKEMQFTKIADHLNFLSSREKLGYSSLLGNLDLSTLESKFQEPLLHLPSGTPNFFDMVNPLVDRLIDQGFLVGNLPGKSAFRSLTGHGILPLTWENFSTFAKDVHLAIERLVNVAIETIIDSVTKLLEESVQFYDCFLEKQYRYQQETVEQRQFEQNWLLERRQGLEKIRDDVNLTLTSLKK